MKINLRDFLAFAESLDGKTLRTVRGKPFTVHVSREGLLFTPASTGKPRRHNHAYIERVHEVFEATGSFLVKDYPFTVDASYHLPLIKLYFGQKKTG